MGAAQQQDDYGVQQAAASRARTNVVAQLSEQILASDAVGSRGLVTQRINEVIDAERHGDREAVRAAWFELTTACAAQVISLDLR